MTLMGMLARSDGEAGLVIVPRLHHFGIATLRPEEMVEWYRSVFGMEIAARFSFPAMNLTFLSNDRAHHGGVLLNTESLQDESLEQKQSHIRIQHLAWQYASIDELLQTWERLSRIGIEPVVCHCHGVSFSFYYRDPDRNLIELLADAWTDPGEALEYIKGPELQANPGALVDPLKLIGARDRGADLAELRDRALAHDYLPAEPAAADAAL
jgi:catechol 2,3-dioxygenase-like lactoylglutathione lyase family enzyme